MPKRKPSAADAPETTELRIIGGKYRGSKLLYHGDPVTRPMKHRVREAIFNLISTESKGRHAIDLFAGTGALGLEALSRGAVSATFIEKHVPTARIVQENIAALNLDSQCELLTTSAFLWSKRDLPKAESGERQAGEPRKADSAFRLPLSELPWLVFCSPPYAFFVERQAEMLTLIQAMIEHAPPESIFVVEADERFDFSLLPGEIAQERHAAGWQVRSYPPAVVGILRSTAD